MPNEFLVRKGLIVSSSAQVTGSVNVTGAVIAQSFTGSFSGSVVGAGSLAGGTTNYIPLWTGTNSLSSSAIFQNAGNVGIGTSSPQNILHVNGSNAFVRISNSSTSDGGLKISYQNSDTHGLHLSYNPGGALAYIDNTYPTSSGQVYGDIYIRQNINGTMTTRMMIQARTGNVGIGTTSPSTTLHVQGNISASSYTGSFGGDGSQITGISAGALPGGLISSSLQFNSLTSPFTGSFTGSFAGTHTGTFPYTSLTNVPAGIVSSSIQIDHNATTNYVANRHIDHTAVSISSGTGLTGGGDISTSRTLALTGQALAFHNLATNGLVTRTAADTITARSVAGGTGITVTNGDGVAGNPTVALTSNTISGVALGSNLNALTISSPLSGTSYNGSAAVTIALASGYGDTQNPYASKTANFFLAAPNGTAGVPTFRAIVAADIPTLNQSTTGQAGSVANAATFNNGGVGDASGTTYNGSVARTISYNTVGAPSTTGTGASGNWGINITGTAPAGTLTGTTLASNVVASSLTSVGTLSSLTVTNNITSTGGIISAGLDYRLNAQSYSRVADLDSGGGFGGGYNLVIDVATAKHDSLGPIAGYHYKSGGTIEFYTGTSAAAGTTATSRMTIDANGNLGVGVTSIPAGQRLRVAGGDVGFEGQYLYMVNANAEIAMGAAQNARIINSDSTNTLQIARTGASSIITLSTVGVERVRIDASGNLGIGTISPNARLSVNGNSNITGSLDVTGAFTAQTKSFKIAHQKLEGKSLVYGVLEGQEHAVYARGKLTGNTIELPEEWSWLVDMESITVQLTPIGSYQKLYVREIHDTTITIATENLFNTDINCYYLVHATRKDVPPLQTVV